MLVRPDAIDRERHKRKDEDESEYYAQALCGIPALGSYQSWLSCAAYVQLMECGKPDDSSRVDVVAFLPRC